jgi:hypothetical protein
MRFFLLLILVFLNAGPVSKKDKEFVVFYICDIKGRYEFDKEGRGGLATISELKKREERKETDHRGAVFLISSGNFAGIENEFKAHYRILNSVGFDASFISEEELLYAEENPIYQKLNLPILSYRENKLNYPLTKILKYEDYNFRLSSSLDSIEDTSFDAQLVFHQYGSFDYLKTFQPTKPTFFFINQKDQNDISYNKKNLYILKCPELNEIGKLTLFYREHKLIRQKQEVIPLNNKKINSDWIHPDRNLINELE